ncbi:MAG TPA: DUF2079 domain-containing protein [Acidimicrobiales bacterium]|nr:DUF2079 domain-containing protein [Acidimicrobiales bacterium]
MIPNRSFRRRADFALLRWQARLDGEWADRVLPWVVAAVLALVFAALSLARARSFDTGIDLATWVQGAWKLNEGLDPEITITGRHLFAPQLAIGFAPIALVTRLLAPIPTLLVVQAVALGLVVVPLWGIARRICDLRVGASLAVVVAYAVFPPVHALNLDGFHTATVALPFLVAAAYTGMRGHPAWTIVLAVAAMALRADLGFAVAALGVVMTIEKRPRLGAALFVGGLAWTTLALVTVQHQLADGFAHAEAFADFGDTVPGAVWGLITSPGVVIGRIMAEDSFDVAVGLLAPLAFLPVLAPRYLFPILPPMALVLVADVPLAFGDGLERLVPAIAFVLLALPFALARIGRRSIERVLVDRRVLGALGLAAIVFFVHDSPSSPYREPWGWGSRDATDAARLAAIERIDEGDGVRSSPSLLAELASRRRIEVLLDDPATGVGSVGRGVDVAVWTDAETESWSPLRRAAIVDGLDERGWDVDESEAGVTFARRPPPD